MKKLITVIILVHLSFSAVLSQSEDKFRFGLGVTAQPSWLRSNDTKRVDPSGAVFGSGFGLVFDYKLKEHLSIFSGIGGDFEGGWQDFKDTVYYVVNSDDEIQPFENQFVDSSIVSTYMLQRRKLRTTAISIPIILKMSLDEMKGVKYFGQFGMNLGYLVKTRSTDEVKQVYVNGADKGYTEETLTDFNPFDGTIPIRMGLNVGIGGEYKLKGTSSLFCSINYVHQFINTFKESTDYYANKISKNSSGVKVLTDRAKMTAYGSAIQINFGIFF